MTVLLSSMAPLSFAADTLARRGSVAGNERRDKEGVRTATRAQEFHRQAKKKKKQKNHRRSPLFFFAHPPSFSLSINTHSLPQNLRPSPSSRRWSRASGPRTRRCSSRPPRSSGSCCPSVRILLFFFSSIKTPLDPPSPLATLKQLGVRLLSLPPSKAHPIALATS